MQAATSADLVIFSYPGAKQNSLGDSKQMPVRRIQLKSCLSDTIWESVVPGMTDLLNPNFRVFYVYKHETGPKTATTANTAKRRYDDRHPRRHVSTFDFRIGLALCLAGPTTIAGC